MRHTLPGIEGGHAMKRFVKPAILIAAVLLAVTVLAPSAQG